MSILQKIRGINFRKCLSCIILIWIFSLVVFPNVYSQDKTKGKNWVINPGFEEMEYGWSLTKLKSEVISDQPFSEKNCVIIRGGGYNVACQDIDVIPEKTYYFSCFVRTSSNKDIKWEAVVQEGEKWLTHAFGQKQLKKWTKTNTLTFIPEGNQIRIALWNYKGEGDVYYDDIYLSLDPPAGTAAILKNKETSKLKKTPEYQRKSPAPAQKKETEKEKGMILNCNPNSRQLVFLPGEPGQLKQDEVICQLDLPKGFVLEEEGFTTWTWLSKAIRPFVVPEKIEKLPGLRRDGLKYERYNLIYKLTAPTGIPIEADKTYIVTVLSKTDLQEGNIELLLRWGDKNLVGPYVKGPAFNKKKDWHEVSFEAKPPSDACYLSIWFNKAAGTITYGDFWVEKVSLKEKGSQKELLPNGDFEKGLITWNKVGFKKGIGISITPEGRGLHFHIEKDKTPYQYGIYNTIVGPMPADQKIRTAPLFFIGDVKPSAYQIFYRWLSKDGTKSTEKQKILVNVRARENLSPPKHLDTGIWLAESAFLGHPKIIQDTLIGLAKDSFIKTAFLHAPNPDEDLPNIKKTARDLVMPVEMVNYLKSAGLEVGFYLAWTNGSGSFSKDFCRNYPETHSISWNGKPSPNFKICQTYILQEGKSKNPYWRVFVETAERLVRETQPSALFWDFENYIPIPSPEFINNPASSDHTMGLSACFCQRCVNEFKRIYNIKDLNTPSKQPIVMEGYPYDKLPEPARSIIKNYPKEWINFSMSRIAQTTELIAQAVKRANPETEFIIYTGLHTHGYFRFEGKGIMRHSENCGISWPLVAPFIDKAMACHNPGFSRTNEITVLREVLRKAAGGRNVPIISDVYISADGTGEFSGAFYARIIKHIAISGVGGVALSSGQIHSLSSLEYKEVRQALADIALLEDYFVKGRQVNGLIEIEPQEKNLKSAVWMLGEDRVVVLVNEDRYQKMYINLKNLALGPAPQYRWKVQILHDEDTIIDNPEEIEIELEPLSAKIILMKEIFTDKL
ncbi:MAG: hypothetical protein ABIK53_07830 [bacterium]